MIVWIAAFVVFEIGTALLVGRLLRGVYCGDPSDGSMQDVRLCGLCLTYAHERFGLPMTLDNPRLADLYRERGYAVTP